MAKVLRNVTRNQTLTVQWKPRDVKSVVEIPPRGSVPIPSDIDPKENFYVKNYLASGMARVEDEKEVKKEPRAISTSPPKPTTQKESSKEEDKSDDSKGKESKTTGGSK